MGILSNSLNLLSKSVSSNIRIPTLIAGDLTRHCKLNYLVSREHEVPRSIYRGVRRFSTTVPSDPDTHEDFRPSNKIQNSGPSLDDIVEKDVKENPVMIYMKGILEYPQCGFSALAVRVLREYNVPLGSRNILKDFELKNAVKAYSHWPTFPQIFINGEFVGGSDIILSMHQVWK